ncbi:MAG TPA: hypothetical protein VE133_15725 [Candidatus Sulfotelmatobacter sp.]|nr:hypothetical protein [Candidatus Sulfotelmatobacter sp.]
MEDRNKPEQIDRQNRDQETDKKPAQGSQDVNRQQQGQPDQQKEREKKPA